MGRSAVLNSICNQIFDLCVKQNSSYKNTEYRVSLLRPIRRCRFSKGHKWYYLYLRQIVFLEVVARHQTIQGEKVSSVSFRSGQGFAGIAYQDNIVVNENVVPYNNSNPNLYLDEFERRWRLPKKKTMSLNIKSSSFLCVPINYQHTDTVYGVISIDCVKQVSFSARVARDVEQMAAVLTPIFSLDK